ncbi:MAG: DUF3102 domain-containing protein [Clostridia bacterium]|nr:DUF3102 domain-containing protein [Clostridia bacterium]
MNNAIIGAAPTVPAREIGIVTAEIKELCLQANRTALMYAIEIGRRLCEAKSVLPHGEWGAWLRDEVNFSQSTANNFMKLFDEYGSAQISIFGAVSNSQTIENLPYSKALQLLAIPSDEREAFAKEVDAENISVKELQAAIKEREELRAKQEELRERAEEAEKARDEAERKASEADELKKKLAEANDRYMKDQAELLKVKENLKKAKADPKIPPEKLAEIKAEAEKAAKEETEKALSLELDSLKKAVQEAERARIEAERAAKAANDGLAEAKNALKTASPAVTAFKALFDVMQDNAAKLKKRVENIRSEDPETATKLDAALRAFGESLGR